MWTLHTDPVAPHPLPTNYLHSPRMVPDKHAQVRCGFSEIHIPGLAAFWVTATNS